MKTELEKYGVSVVALSKDTVEQGATHKNRDDLKLTLLSDESLNVIRLYGVEHHKALGFSTNKYKIGPMPLVLMPSIKMMAIPTSLLIDENGTILWIDQSDDYRIRSDGERVLSAVTNSFIEKLPTTSGQENTKPGVK